MRARKGAVWHLVYNVQGTEPAPLTAGERGNVVLVCLRKRYMFAQTLGFAEGVVGQGDSLRPST